MATDLELAKAFEASERAYGLLLWLGGLLDDDRISPDQVSMILASPEGAARFIAGHRASLPTGLNSPELDDETANILGSYLSVSFNLDPEPAGVRRPDLECCAWCGFEYRKGLHLKAKPSTKADKTRAEARSRLAVRSVIEEAGIDPDDDLVHGLVRSYQDDAATIAYARSLVDRAQGFTPGTTALALWRRFAWRNGAPRRGLNLNVGTVRAAEQRLVQAAESRLGGTDDR